MQMRIERLSILGLAACAAAMTAASAHAQDWKARVSSPVAPPAAKAVVAAPVTRIAKEPPASAQSPRPLPQVQIQTHFLIRTTLLALNDANRTGNYTVLRDLAAPSFRDRNSAADLAQIFAEMRRAKLDLGIAALLPPELDGGPQLDAARRLILKGHYATEPYRVLFDLQFETVAGNWLLHGVSISTAPARTAANIGPPAAMR
jgi:hypothetical protein